MYQCVLTALVGSSPRVRGKRRPRGRRPHPRRLIPARAGKTLFAVCMSLVWLGSSPRVRGKRRSCRGFGAEGGLIPARAGKTAHYSTALSHSAAHPRACGENLISLGADLAATGSSPRVRGKPRGRPHPSASPMAHPRACGENQKPPSERNCSLGSSPRVRGKLQGRRHRKPPERLIPARAGKTGPRSPQRGPPAAHPRACGENLSGIGSTLNTWGSSPRVRGKRAELHSLLHELGLIPARAGKTAVVGAGASKASAHPRACGENVGNSDTPNNTNGSSPRVRGKPDRGHGPPVHARLIPARAGKTKPRSRRSPLPWAHPRACGENLSAETKADAAAGSSPRVRGKRRVRRGTSRAAGLIPARAGKTWSRPKERPGPRAHPRACGENAFFEDLDELVEGSSPRVRGKPR